MEMLRNRKLEHSERRGGGYEIGSKREESVRSCKALFTMVWDLEFIQNSRNHCF